MKRKNIYRGVLGAALTLGAMASCTPFEEINRPLGNVSAEDLKTDNITGQNAIKQMFNYAFPQQENAFQMTYDLIGNYYGRYFAEAVDGWNSSKTTTYNAPDGWASWPYNNIWPGLVKAMTDLKDQVGTNDPAYYWALILRAHTLITLTDTYGPFPFGGKEPGAFASQKEVYTAIISDLDDATDYLSKVLASDPGLTLFPEADPIYSGQMSRWRLFANSLKLRIALRLSLVEPKLSQALAEKAVRAGVIESNSDNLTYLYKPAGIYKTSVEWGNSLMSAEMDSYLNGYNDPRVSKYFAEAVRPADRTRVGLPVGSFIGSMKTADEMYSKALWPEDKASVWMTAAEVAFLRAEGALRGWEMGGDPKSWYEKGVELSFQQWGASGSDQYLANSTDKPSPYINVSGGYGKNMTPPSDCTIAWEDEAPFEKKLERIMIQKWIAGFPIGSEAWADIRRTGYPKIFRPIQATPGYNIATANRVPYPVTEATKDPKNFALMESLLDGPNDYATKMWWQK